MAGNIVNASSILCNPTDCSELRFGRGGWDTGFENFDLAFLNPASKFHQNLVRNKTVFQPYMFTKGKMTKIYISPHGRRVGVFPFCVVLAWIQEVGNRVLLLCCFYSILPEASGLNTSCCSTWVEWKLQVFNGRCGHKDPSPREWSFGSRMAPEILEGGGGDQEVEVAFLRCLPYTENVYGAANLHNIPGFLATDLTSLTAPLTFLTHR